MTDPKELKKLINLLRKEGITEYKDGTLEFKIGAPLTKVRKYKSAPQSKKDVSDQVNDIPTDEPTQEELMNWSVGGATDYYTRTGSN